MEIDPPLTPDVDLPGQQRPQADLDIVVEPEPGPEPEGSPEADASDDDPELGNTLVRPDNS